MTKANKSVVYLVGAGPGDPELLTLRAASLLATADVILHDDLVPQSILNLANTQAVVINVGKRCGMKRITQEEIHALMIHTAKCGQSVVRLKSGDPLVFGRAAEEMDALCSANIAFEVVPGITAAFAAAASLRTSFTDRRAASKIIFTTGHQATHVPSRPSNTENDGCDIWQGPLPQDATLIIYMPGRDYSTLAKNLLHQGVSSDTPCVAVSNAGRPEQIIGASTLGQLGELEAAPSPALLLIGKSMAAAMEKATTVSESIRSLAS